jgi:hypothetical protein
MAIHIIPESEKEKHIEDAECVCEPNFEIDDESGEMVWVHQIMDYEKILEGFLKM